MKEYKVVIYQENLLSSLFFGSQSQSRQIQRVPQQPNSRRLACRNHGKRPTPYALIFQT